MSDDLVKRLRWKAGAYAKEAANRIEQLAATVEKLEEKNSRLKLDLLLANDVADAAIEGKKELEAKLAKAVEGLENVSRLVDNQYADRLYTQTVAGWEQCADDVKDVARTTLAELTGGKDE